MAQYLSEIDLRKEIENYQNQCKKSKEKPFIDEKIALFFKIMIKKLAGRYNFRNYTNLSDMKSEAMVKCLQSISSFDLNKKTKEGKLCSSFSYFTQIIWNSFVYDIKEFNKNIEIPIEYIENIDETQIDDFKLYFYKLELKYDKNEVRLQSDEKIIIESKDKSIQKEKKIKKNKKNKNRKWL